MPYCTLTDLKKSIPEEEILQLTDDENLEAINEERVTDCISQADALIDSYCAAKYTLPFSSVPQVIKNLSVDITIYNLYSRKVLVIPDSRANRYKDAIKTLDGISKGTITLGVQPQPTGATPDEIKNNQADTDRTFTTDTMSGY